MLKVEQLSFCYPGSDDAESVSMRFDLSVEPGRILSLIGPSGSGKSSLLNLIAGFIRQDSGSTVINGQAVQDLDASERPLSMVFQSYNLFPHLDVYTNIALGLSPSLKLNRDQHQRIEDALEKLGLQGMQKRKPGQLSGGQQQRVTIARVLVRQQPVLLLDEPFAALGPAQRDEMIDLLGELVTSHRMAAILVSHHPADARRASEFTAFMHQGRIIETLPTVELLNSTRIEIQQYLGPA